MLADSLRDCLATLADPPWTPPEGLCPLSRFGVDPQITSLEDLQQVGKWVQVLHGRQEQLGTEYKDALAVLQEHCGDAVVKIGQQSVRLAEHLPRLLAAAEAYAREHHADLFPDRKSWACPGLLLKARTPPEQCRLTEDAPAKLEQHTAQVQRVLHAAAAESPRLSRLLAVCKVSVQFDRTAALKAAQEQRLTAGQLKSLGLAVEQPEECYTASAA